jgi:CheY-like chemotaxis protein
MSISVLKNSECTQLEKKPEPYPEIISIENITILLIDDEEMVVKITEKMLRKIGYKVLKAISGYEGLEIFKAFRNQIDIVICDMIMPKMDGLELVHRIRAIDPCVKVLLSSGSLIDEDEKDVVNRGFDGLVKKPYMINDLSHKIESILQTMDRL